jgi:uncharacterized membrane protein
MPPFNLLYTLHALAAMIWTAGLLLACVILRPVALTTKAGPARLVHWASTGPRWLPWVWGCVAVLPISGVAILRLDYRGFDGAPRYVQAMMGLYVVMVAVFLRIQSLQLPQLRSAVAAEDWPAGAAAVKRIRRLAAISLCLGVAVLMIAVAHRYSQG